MARAEANFICNTDNQYIVPTSGNPIRGLIQDHVASGVKLTCKDTFLTREQFQQLLYVAVTGLSGIEVISPNDIITVPLPAVLKPAMRWTGKQVISSLINHLLKPPLAPFNLDGKTRTPATAFGVEQNEHVVIFRHNELLCGILDKAAVGNASLGIVHTIYELYGSELAGKILGAFGRLFTYHLQNVGHSCGIEDLLLTENSDKERQKLLLKVSLDGQKGLQQFIEGGTNSDANDSNKVKKEKITSSNGLLPSELFEYEKKIALLLSTQRVENKVKLDGAMQSVINKSASDVIKACLPNGLQMRFPYNNFSMMVLTGAKGSAVNQSQISCFLGQQALEGQRVPIMVSGKTLPSFRAYDTSIRAGGFITDRFLTGIKPQEYYFHCMAGREGLVDTAVKTSRSGYLQRCLIKHLEELKVTYDMTVRDSNSNVVQFLYGEDGLDTVSANILGGSANQMLFLAKNSTAYIHKYSIFQGFMDQGFNEQEGIKYHKLIKKAKESKNTNISKPSQNMKFSKKSIVTARKKIRPNLAWSRNNMHKKWFVAEIIKVRSKQTNQNRVEYDLRYLDGSIEKYVPAKMKITSRAILSGNENFISATGMVDVIRPGIPDPALGTLDINNCLGSCSEKFQEGIDNYIKSNPDNVIGLPTENNNTIAASAFRLLMWIKYMRSFACPGEAVGCIAAQSVGEPSTQMTLNTFHLAGHGGANVTLGIPRLREIIM